MKEAQLIVDGKTINITISDEELTKLQTSKPKKTGYERATEGEKYWAIDELVSAESDFESDNTYNDELYKNANYFSDVIVANNMARAQLLWNRIHKRAVELCEPIKDKWYTIAYNVLKKTIAPEGFGVYKWFGSVVFDTKEHCQQVIDEFHNELLWYFTEFRDRADM